MQNAIEIAAKNLEALRIASLLGDCHVRQLHVLAKVLVEGKGDDRTASDFVFRFRDWNSYGRGSRG